MNNINKPLGYIPSIYWTQAGKDYYKNFIYTPQFVLQETELLKYLERLEFKSVLELGCGFGRITRLISKNFPLIEKYVAIDVSKDQLKIAREICPDNVEFIEAEIYELVTGKWIEKFDLVIAVEVLMHQLPSQIHKIIDKMIDWSSHHIISLDYFSQPTEKLAPYNFLYNYPNLYYLEAKKIQIGKQAIFHVDKQK